MYHNYSITGWHWKDGELVGSTVKASAMIAEYERLGLPVPKWFTDFLSRGSRYSYEDFDTLSAVMSDLYKRDPEVWTRIGKIDPKYLKQEVC